MEQLVSADLGNVSDVKTNHASNASGILIEQLEVQLCRPLYMIQVESFCSSKCNPKLYSITVPDDYLCFVGGN